MDKKKKAAICGLIAFLEDDEKRENRWSRSGKEIIMKNRQMVQEKKLNRRY